MNSPPAAGKGRRWPIGTKLRYWHTNGRYSSVKVVGYTKSGRVRVQLPTNSAGYTQTSAVMAKRLSVV